MGVRELPLSRVVGNPGEGAAELGQEAAPGNRFFGLPFPSSWPWTERRGEDGSI